MKQFSIIIFVFYSFLVFGQRVCDSYLISNEPNTRSFIGVNHVDHYESEMKEKSFKGEHYKHIRSVQFNGWFEVGEVEEQVLQKDRKLGYKTVRNITTSFTYNLTTAKLIRIVKNDIRYLEGSKYIEIDSIQIAYDQDNISSYFIESSFIDFRESGIKELYKTKGFDSFAYDGSNLVMMYDVVINDYFHENFIDSSVALPESKHIDSILMTKDTDFINSYNYNSQIKLSLNNYRKREYIYNALDQLVFVIEASNRDTINPTTYHEKLPTPNPSYDVYSYDNKSYLLKKILYFNSKSEKYNERKFNYSYRY